MTLPAWRQASDALHERVRRWIVSGADAATLEPLALDIAQFQAGHVEPLRRLWHAHGLTGHGPRAAAEIPALPCDLFRLRRVAVHPADEDDRCFRTSGTTQAGGPRGEHAMRTTATYALAALRWGGHMLWPDRTELRFIGLVPPEQQALDSSLIFMLARFAEQLDEQPSWHGGPDGLDVDAVAHACAQARRRQQPALVAGTSLALAELTEELDPASLALPAGSRVLHTGGFKRQARAIDAAALRERAAALFHVPRSHVVAEYGMTELSSQLYEGSLRRALGVGCEGARPGCYYPPPWMRLRVIDPHTMRPAARGQEGLCEILDVANVDSAVVILTGDLVRQRRDGSIELLGRAAGVAERGCSLAF